jgi:23S rRNA (cytidine1920-2'-O)/16S rRNA (cytidine1409-2'-O)-methyltransferase
MERTNARNLRPGSLPEPVDLAVVDVSFISLALILGPVAGCLAAGDSHGIVALVKPQFEAGREAVGRGGIVRDPAVHRAVLERVAAAAEAAGLGVAGAIASPITGADGNREFLLHLRPGLQTSPDVGARFRELAGP